MGSFLLNISKLLTVLIDKGLADNQQSQLGGADGVGGAVQNSSDQLVRTSQQVHEILGGIVGPCMSVIGSIGIIYMIVMGVQYAKAESDEKRAEFKTRMINLAIGLIIILILVVLCMAIRWDVVIPEVFGYFAAE